MKAWIEAHLRNRLGTDCTAQPVVGLGSVNEVWMVHGSLGSAVVRLREDAQNEYRKEAWCIQAAFRAQIPVPTVLGVEEWEGQAVMLETLEPGVPGSQAPERQLEIWRALGEYARKLAAVPVSGFGNLLLQDGVFGDTHSPTLDQMVAYNAAQLTPQDPLVMLDVYEATQREAVRQRLYGLLGQTWTLGLCHGDLSPSNTLVSGDRILLLDFGCAHVGPVPYAELLQVPEEEHIRQAFLEGYGLLGEDALWANLRRLQLLNRLDKLRWALDHGVPHLLRDYVIPARHAVQQALEV